MSFGNSGDLNSNITMDAKRSMAVPLLIMLSSRMWASAQRDGRPAEYRWRSLFNAAKFG